MSPFMGGGFGSGLRPQYPGGAGRAGGARAAALGARRADARSRCTRSATGRRMIQRIALGAKADGTLDAITHEAIAVTSQYEDFAPQGDRLVRRCSTSAPTRSTRTSSRGSIFRRRATCARRAPRPASMRSNAPWTSSRSRSSSIRSSCACAAIRTATRTTDQPYSSKSAARMLPAGRGGVRLGQAQPRAALDARRQRAGRLGHGDRRLGSAADADRGAHRAHRQRPCGGVLRHLRHRHRHLHDHGAGRGRHARPAARQRHASSSATRRCRNRRSKADRGSRPRCRTGSRRPADAVREELLRLAKTDAELAARGRRTPTRSRSRTASS